MRCEEVNGHWRQKSSELVICSTVIHNIFKGVFSLSFSVHRIRHAMLIITLNFNLKKMPPLQCAVHSAFFSFEYQTQHPILTLCWDFLEITGWAQWNRTHIGKYAGINFLYSYFWFRSTMKEQRSWFMIHLELRKGRIVATNIKVFG